MLSSKRTEIPCDKCYQDLIEVSGKPYEDHQMKKCSPGASKLTTRPAA